MRFGAASFDGGSVGDDEDYARMEDADTHRNNTRPTATRHIGAQGSRMLSALFEGIDADFFSLVSGCVISMQHRESLSRTLLCERKLSKRWWNRWTLCQSHISCCACQCLALHWHGSSDLRTRRLRVLCSCCSTSVPPDCCSITARCCEKESMQSLGMQSTFGLQSLLCCLLTLCDS